MHSHTSTSPGFNTSRFIVNIQWCAEQFSARPREWPRTWNIDTIQYNWKSFFKFLDSFKKDVTNFLKQSFSCWLAWKECMMCIENLVNGLNMGVPLWVKKTVHGVETHWLSNKEKVLGAVVSKEGHAELSTLAQSDSTWKGPIYGSNRTVWHINRVQTNDLC